jgi:outer membrane protein
MRPLLDREVQPLKDHWERALGFSIPREFRWDNGEVSSTLVITTTKEGTMIRVSAFTAAMLALATALNLPSAQATENAPLLRLGAGVGALYIQPDVDSPVVGAKLSNDAILTVSLYFFPGEALVDAFKWAKYVRVSTELGIITSEVMVNGARVGQVSTIPLNANLEFHPLPYNRIDPFVGAGANLTFFTSQKEGLGNFEPFGPEVGALLLAGVDYWIAKNFFAEARVRKIYVSTDVVPRATGTKLETITVDPWTYGFTLGYRF